MNELNELIHRLPLRENYDVEVKLPRDLTAKEMQRIVRWLETLGPQEEGQEPDPNGPKLLQEADDPK